MLILLYLTGISTALYWVVRLLSPEMAKPPLPATPRTPRQPRIVEAAAPNPSDDRRTEKLETLLAEKNKNISLLQTELRVFYTQVREFDKVKLLLEDEIRRLKEQNRIFRSELGIPTVVPRENLTRLFL